VFLVARVHEARMAGLGEREAIASGLAQTGRLITSAAAIMLVVFGAFGIRTCAWFAAQSSPLSGVPRRFTPPDDAKLIELNSMRLGENRVDFDRSRSTCQ
jgi:hypothetical protein